MNTKTDTTPVVVTNNAPATIDLSDDEWAGVEDGDLSPATARSIPLLALNRKADNNGGFIDSETGEKSMTVDAVLLAKLVTRAWWPEAFGKGDKAPTCRSADGVVPDPLSPEVQHQACATCPNNRWDDQGDKDFRRCRDSIEMLVFLPEASGGRLARVRFGGLAYAPAKTYWDSFSARMPKAPPLSVLTHIELVAEDAPPNGTFLVPHFSRVMTLTRAEAQPLIDERDRRIAEWTATVAEDVATGATREDGGGTAPTADPGAYTPTTEYGDEPF